MHSAVSTPAALGEADSLAHAAAWIGAALPGPAKTVTLIGAGFGHALDVLERQSPGAQVLVLEPDPAAAAALLARRDWTAWLATGRLAVLSGPDYTGAAQAARLFRDLHTAPILVHPHLARHHPDEVLRARQALTRLTFEARANDGARRTSAGRYLLHTLTNLPRLARESDVRALAGLGARQPAIVAAAGPSLDRNLPDILPVRDRAIVIACDTAARPLALGGVDPDLIVATDSSRVNAGHLAALPAGRGWLVAEGSVHASAFPTFDRRTFVFRVSGHQPWPWLASLGLDRGTLDTWGSVATSALSLALAMECDPIVLVGADFAFTGGRPYCRGTSFEPQWARWNAAGGTPESIWRALVDRWPPVVAPDIAGQPARTAAHLVAFRDWIVERAATCGDRRVVNATGAGLLHGSAIEQGSLGSVLGRAATALPLDLDALHRRLRTAHASACGDLRRVLKGVDEILAAPAHPQRNAWAAFTEGIVPGGAVDVALRSPEHTAWSLALASPAYPEDQL
jgi:hypothetical protein